MGLYGNRRPPLSNRRSPVDRTRTTSGGGVASSVDRVKKPMPTYNGTEGGQARPHSSQMPTKREHGEATGDLKPKGKRINPDAPAGSIGRAATPKQKREARAAKDAKYGKNPDRSPAQKKQSRAEARRDRKSTRASAKDERVKARAERKQQRFSSRINNR